ncbi:MAG TPA: histidine phosphatase family protein [Microvirga sp.]|nr:histidine phosphatase family protein [Microvirga sp.]
MTTVFHLVRHAAHDRVGSTLCGRMPGVSLGALGREQAGRLGQRFARESIASVQSSPLERARETAEPIAAQTGCTIEINEGIVEIEFGAWSGRTFEELGSDSAWATWNGARAVARPPRGETMLEAQSRIVHAMEALRGAYRDKAVVLVSHSDVIKAALLYHLGLPVDAYPRIEIEPASISTLVVGDWGAKVVRLNEVVAS